MEGGQLQSEARGSAGGAEPRALTLLSVGRRAHDPEEVDARGDAVFRFSLDPRAGAAAGSLQEFHRGLLQDLLAIVQLHFRGEPVLVDSFSFLNSPDEVIAILPAGSLE